MNTTFRICEKREACTNCSTISPDDRLFLNPMVPVAQNLQPILHPTCNKRKKASRIRYPHKKMTQIHNLSVAREDRSPMTTNHILYVKENDIFFISKCFRHQKGDPRNKREPHPLTRETQKKKAKHLKKHTKKASAESMK